MKENTISYLNNIFRAFDTATTQIEEEDISLQIIIKGKIHINETFVNNSEIIDILENVCPNSKCMITDTSELNTFNITQTIEYSNDANATYLNNQSYTVEFYTLQATLKWSGTTDPTTTNAIIENVIEDVSNTTIFSKEDVISRSVILTTPPIPPPLTTYNLPPPLHPQLPMKETDSLPPSDPPSPSESPFARQSDESTYWIWIIVIVAILFVLCIFITTCIFGLVLLVNTKMYTKGTKIYREHVPTTSRRKLVI